MAARTDYLGRDGYTWWVGEVEDIEDPSQIGRVRVRILGWYTGNSEGDAYLKEVPRENSMRCKSFWFVKLSITLGGSS